jgi:hypothetical protein
MSGIDRSKVAYMIYSIYKNNGKGIVFSEGKPNGINLKSFCECIKEGLKPFFLAAIGSTCTQGKPNGNQKREGA